jgi:hypothetical protein
MKDDADCLKPGPPLPLLKQEGKLEHINAQVIAPF